MTPLSTEELAFLLAAMVAAGASVMLVLAVIADHLVQPWLDRRSRRLRHRIDPVLELDGTANLEDQ